MSAVYNPESDIIAEIERLELEARDIRRRVEHAHNEEDRRVLNKQLEEIKAEGGLTFAQDDTAQQTSMPHSAIDAGVVDCVMPAEELGRQLSEYLQEAIAGLDSVQHLHWLKPMAAPAPVGKRKAANVKLALVVPGFTISGFWTAVGAVVALGLRR